MTESPWAARSPRPAESRRPANWGFYLGVNLGIGLAAGFVGGLLQKSGIPIPDLVINLLVLYVTTMLAGGRWLKDNGYRWDKTDRHRLALSYVTVNLVTGLIVLGAFWAIIASGYEDQLGLPANVRGLVDGSLGVMVPVIVVVAFGIALSLAYGLMRLTLFYGLNGRAKRGSTGIADEFS